MNETDEKVIVLYDVVVNDEDQYSVWRSEREIPAGWYSVGYQATREECLAYVESVWTDMRPKSLREQMDTGKQALKDEL